MGSCISDAFHHSKDNQHLKVATLNYGGILNSPFQFFSDSEGQEKKISTIFRQILPSFIKDFDQKTFKWDIGKIDQKIQKQRYTPIYRPKIGVQNHKLLGEQEFYQRWNQQYKQASKQIKVQPEPTAKQIGNMRLFDFICYYTLLKYVYPIKSTEEITKCDPQNYIKLTQRYFSRSYLDESKKIKKVRQALQKHSADVFCFQEPTKSFIDQLKGDNHFQVFQKGAGASMLLIKKQNFKQIKNGQEHLKKFLTQEQLRELNWDRDTCFAVCDKYIIFSGHLSSKKQKNEQQVKQMKKSLNNLRNKCKGYEIIVGADTNSFVTNEGIRQFSVFPGQKEQVTTKKKRTFLQPQFNKADIINEECKDQIFSTLDISKTKVITIQKEEINPNKPSRTLLPSENHPFDHFMVVCEIEKMK